MKMPCKDCKNRRVESGYNCHDHCEAYLAAKILLEAQRLHEEPMRRQKCYRRENYDRVLSRKHK